MLKKMLELLVAEYGYHKVDAALTCFKPQGGVTIEDLFRTCVVKGWDTTKINCIKAYRHITDEGLYESKHWVDDRWDEIRKAMS